MPVYRPKLVSQKAVVEYRSSSDRYFICYPDLKMELVMAFKSKQTAAEIAINAEAGTPFFTMIPTVDYDTPYPRPDYEYPPVRNPAVFPLVLKD